jgi:hypothetical protein
MQVYRDAYRVTAGLKKQHDVLVEQQRALLTLIEQAEAAENKAREAMLRAIQESNGFFS